MLIIFTAAMALVFTSLSGIISMYNIRGQSAKSLTDQLEKTVDVVVDGKSSLADSRLGLYADYITTLSELITDMYAHPDAYVHKEVLPPDASKENILSMQRYFTTHEVKRENVLEELGLFGSPLNRAEPERVGKSIRQSPHKSGTEYGYGFWNRDFSTRFA